MLLFDVNILVYTHRKDSPDFSRYQAWFQEPLDGAEPFGGTGHRIQLRMDFHG